MAKIDCPREYNYWYILANIGIDPSIEIDRYQYDEEKEELFADVTQEKLDNALEQYDHQAWLRELEGINNPKSKEQVLEGRLQIAEDALLFLMDINLMGGM